MQQFRAGKQVTVFITKNNLTNLHLIIPDHIYQAINVNPFNQHQIFTIGIGYPLNYLDSYDKLFSYLQLYKLKGSKSIDSFVNWKDHLQLRKIEKIPNQFDTNMLPYFKQLNQTLFEPSRFKLANYLYRAPITQESASEFCNEFYLEIHSQIVHNIIQLRNFILQHYSSDLHQILLSHKMNQNTKAFLQNALSLEFKLCEGLPQELLPYTPGYLIV